MTDDAFIRTILAAPDDDGPRLVYADWLEDQGQSPRAELIRVQIEMANMSRWVYAECKVCSATPNYEGDINHGKGCYVLDSDGGGSEGAEEEPRWVELYDRTRALLANDNWYRWSRPVPVPFSQESPDHLSLFYVPTFARGFVEKVAMPWNYWYTRADEILSLHPIQEVHLTTPMEMQANEHLNQWRLRGSSPFEGPFRQWRTLHIPASDSRWQTAAVPLLKAEWPSVKVWHWPEPAPRIDELDTAMIRQQIMGSGPTSLLDPRFLIRGPT
jgi:uncharacterized protein (TIGR02996 family)